MTMSVYVGNLSFQTTQDQVFDLFSEFGEVYSVTLISDPDTGRFRGFCYVEMEEDAAQNAIEALDGQDYDGRSLRVNEARPRGAGGGQRGGGGGGYGGDRGW